MTFEALGSTVATVRRYKKAREEVGEESWSGIATRVADFITRHHSFEMQVRSTQDVLFSLHDEEERRDYTAEKGFISFLETHLDTNCFDLGVEKRQTGRGSITTICYRTTERFYQSFEDEE